MKPRRARGTDCSINIDSNPSRPWLTEADRFCYLSVRGLHKYLMKRIVFIHIILSVLLLAGAGCPAVPRDQATPAPAAQSGAAETSTTVTEPFDTNDYLNAALEELNAVE